jgi:hypothetical protein
MPTTISRNGRTLREDGWTSARPAGPRALRENLGWTLDRLPDHISVPPFVSLDFARLISELEGHGVEVVTVTMPYAEQLEAALEARNPRWREQRREGFEQLEQAAGIDIVSIEGFGDWARASSFYDLRHLSREGAGPFTRQLWMTPAFRAAVLEGLASAP